MGSLIVVCPRSRHEIDTGIETDHATLRMVRPFQIRVRCPHCNEDHVLEVKDAEMPEIVAPDSAAEAA